MSDHPFELVVEGAALTWPDAPGLRIEHPPAIVTGERGAECTDSGCDIILTPRLRDGRAERPLGAHAKLQKPATLRAIARPIQEVA